MEVQISSQIRIERPLYEHHQLRQDFYYEKPKTSFVENNCGTDNLKIKSLVVNTIPIIGWLPRYKWKSNIISDLISGFTVAIMHIPQGMAYALLGNVPPVVGIYMAFFPVLVYFLLGTSRHNSMGWALKHVSFLEVNLNKYNPLFASSYIRLPKSIENKRAVLNIQNNDDKCFAYAVNAAIFPANGPPHEVSSYPHYTTLLNFEGIDFPVKLNDIHKFEILNNISINVFGVNNQYKDGKMVSEIVGPLHFTNKKQNTHVNLLLIADVEGNTHYTLIKDLSRLVTSQRSKHHGRNYICDGCLLFFNSPEKLYAHERNDCNHLCTILPDTDPQINKCGELIAGNILKFVNIEKQLQLPFVIYADFESLLKPIHYNEPSDTKSFSVKTYQHEPYSFCIYLKCTFDDNLSKLEYYRGVDAVEVFVNKLDELVLQLYQNHLKNIVEMKPLSQNQQDIFNNSQTCHICDKPFENGDEKVRDHCHLTGTFAVVCLMTGKTVLEYSDPSYFKGRSTNSTVDPLIETGYSPVQVASTVTFTVAIFQLAMCALRLGAVSALLSETLVSGFTTGAAIQVLTSQIKELLGLRIPKFKGYFVIWNTIRAIINEIGNVNYAALTISAVTIFVSSINNECIKPIVAKKSVIPIPIELIAVVLGTIISKYCYLPEIYNITTVGEIPNGFPEPAAPQFSLIVSVILDGFTIAIVSYTVTLSMALIFAQKLNYEIDANQELLAMGTGNIIGSFFSCMPFCASLSRSLIQQVVGGKTQIASLVSCSILVVVLLWIGPFFEPLPRSVLAGVIVVALKGMLMQITAVWKFWKLSKMDAVVWMVTFLTVVLVSIDIGLLVGIIMSLITIFILGFKPYTCLLGSVPETDLYLDITRYKGTIQIDGIKIFHYCGGINFATRNIFKDDLIRLIEINPQKEIIYRSKLAQLIEKDEEIQIKSTKNKEKIVKLQGKVNTELRCLIMDFSSVSYIDPSGVSMLKNVIESLQKLNIPVYIAACSDHVYNMMKKCNLIDAPKSSVRVFSTIHDAVKCSSDLFRLSLNSTISCIRL